MSDVVVELLICAMSDVGEKQKNAEAVIYKTRDENLAVFLQELIRVARTETADMRARQMALLLLKNTVAFNAREEAAKKELEDRWKSITPEMRKEVRGEVLATLGSSQREVRTTASNVVANLARIELPHNDWPDLLPSLFQAAQCDGTMEASITTLGYICEETNTCAPLENVLLQYSNDILSCVIRGMQHSDAEVIYQSTNALCNAVTFIHKNMESKEERDYIMSTVCSKCINHEARTMTRAMECLCRIAAEYYSKLVDYMHAIFSITTQALMSNNDDGVMQGFQFWSTICEVEAELLEMDEDLPDQSSPQPTASSEYQKYAQGAAQHILPITLSFLLKQEEFQIEEDWNVSTAAGVCLQRFASVLRNDIGAYVMPFVNDNVSQQNWRNCEAGIMAFACILEGPSSEVLEEVILNSIKALFYYCQNNQHSLVRDTSVWALARIANFHPQIILSRPPLLDEILLVAEKLIGDTPVLANKACSILHNLCLEVEEMFDDEACSTNCMSKYFQRFVRILLQTVDRNDAHEGNLRAAAQETLNSLLGCVAPDVLGEVSSLVPELVSRINKSFSFCGPNVSASMLEEIQLMQGLLCGALQHVIQKLADSISIEQANLIMSAFQSVLQSSQNVHEEALMAVGALASSQGRKFSQYLESLTPHLLSGLRSKNDAKLMNITVGVVGDIYAAIGQLAPEPFTDQIMLILLENIRDEEIWRDCRPSILSAFGDIALHIAENFAKYLPVVVSVLDSADKIANQVDPNDEDLVTFSIDLREAICDAYTGMLQGLKNHPTLVIPAMDSILSFIARNGTNSSDEKLLECCVNVAGDVLNVFSSREARNMYPPIEKFVQDSGIQGMVQRAQSSRNKTLVKAAEWAMKQAQCFFSCK